MKKVIISALAAATALSAAAETPLWLRNVKISPDGKSIAFTYKGDIFTVGVNGGKANRLTTQTSYETTPMWSPDSKSIAFASDRHGNFDIYLMSAEGGQAKRLTTNSAREIPEAFSPDGTKIYYSAAIQAPTKSAMFPSSRMTQLYTVGIDGGASVQTLGTPAQKLSFMPDGQSFVYQDVKGFENEWRKHHTSSVTRDIWLYDAKTGKHTNLTNRPGEDRDPVVSKDGSTLYLLVEPEGATFNVFSAPIDNPGNLKPLTNFATHPVRFLSSSDNGTLAFTYDGEIYTLAPGAASPEKVAIDVTLDDDNTIDRRSVKATGGVPSPNGEQVAFVDRGDVFVTSVEFPSTKQITHTAAAEKSVDWGPDNRSLIYTSMRDGHFNLYEARIARDDDPNFSNATKIEERPLIAVDDIERAYPLYSPDGKSIAFIQDRDKLMIMDVASKSIRQLTDGSTYAYRDGGFEYSWSPDSKWIVMETLGNHHDPYSDIALINVASGEMTRLTNSGYTDQRPRFVMEGNAVVYLSERYGMRNHASWGSQDDAMIVFLNREAYDKFQLSEEDYKLRKEIEKQNKKKADGDDKDSKSKKKSKDKDKDKDNPDEADSKDIVVELDGLEDRTIRLTPYSSDLADVYVTNDGQTIYYLSAVEDGYNLWKMERKDMEPSISNKLNADFAYFATTKDGKKAFIMGDKMRTFDPDSEKVKAISASGSMEIDHAAEREAMLDQVYLSEREMFYTPDLHGVDWDAMTADYRKFLPHINNNYDYADMLSELLGELNVSHTGAGYRGNESNNLTDRTSKLGLLYDVAYEGDGLKVDEIITGGPFDNSWSKMRPGFIVKSVNSEPITAKSDLGKIFNNLSGKKTLVSFEDPATGNVIEEVVLPISSGVESGLLYKRWVKQRAADVERWSDGRLGYVHIESMADDSFREVYSNLLGKYNNCEGVVVDIRWNGGGRLHEDIEVLLSGEKYFTQVIRGVESCDMPSRRWNKPSIMVMAEACYSNAHGTPWVYKHRGIGKLVGMPVPGTMTSVNWVTLQDPSLYFGIPVVGYRLPDGSYLENSQLEPDIKVANDPEVIVTGEDQQLRAAVNELLREIDAKK